MGLRACTCCCHWLNMPPIVAWPGNYSLKKKFTLNVDISGMYFWKMIQLSWLFSQSHFSHFKSIINQQSKQIDRNTFFKYLCKGTNRRVRYKSWDKIPIKPKPCVLRLLLLFISLIIMNQSLSDPSNLPNLLWRFVACCESYNYHWCCGWQLSIS